LASPRAQAVGHPKKKSPSKKKSGSGFENTGRWTSEEHQLFLNGLDSYGKEWKKIAELIKKFLIIYHERREYLVAFKVHAPESQRINQA